MITVDRDTIAPTETMTRQQRLSVFVLLGTGFLLSVDYSILNVVSADSEQLRTAPPVA